MRRPLANLLRRAGRRDRRPHPRATIETFHDELDREIDRCRRYERQFALIAARRTIETSADEIDARLAEVVRTTDRFCLADGHLYLLMPETDADAAVLAIDRLHAHLPGVFDAERTGFATFPSDGVTAVALFDAVRDLDRIGRPTARIDRQPSRERAG